MKKLNDILNNCNVTVYGFQAFNALKDHCNKDGLPVIISTLSAAFMADMGITEYYAPVIPRSTIYNTADEIINADLEVNTVHVTKVPDVPNDTRVIIASRHPGTVKYLEDMYPNHRTLAHVEPADIFLENVVGTLPPHLIQYASSFRAVTIKDFDYAKDEELNGKELKERMIFTSTIRAFIN